MVEAPRRNARPRPLLRGGPSPVRMGRRETPENARPMRFLEPDELAQLAEAHPPIYRPLVFTGYVGMRWGELAGLALDHVDLLR